VVTATLPHKSIVLDAMVQKHLRISKLEIKEITKKAKEDESVKEIVETIITLSYL
jgi:hypothetical protein